MSYKYCGNCKAWHKPIDDRYFGPTYHCYPIDPPPRDVVVDELIPILEERISNLENELWALKEKLNK